MPYPGTYPGTYDYGSRRTTGTTTTAPDAGISPVATLSMLFRRPGVAGGQAVYKPATSTVQSTVDKYTYPEAMPRPSYLDSVLGMTPLQERAQIATGATSGQNTAYGGSDVFGYYRNLALRSLLTPAGGFNEGSQILPVERDYLTKIIKRPPADMSVKAFIDALLRD